MIQHTIGGGDRPQLQEDLHANQTMYVGVIPIYTSKKHARLSSLHDNST